MKGVLAILLWGWLSFGALPAAAHSTSTSFLDVALGEGAAPVALRWDLSLHDLVATVFIDADLDGDVTWPEIHDAESSIGKAVASQIDVRRGGVLCPLRIERYALAQRLDEDYLSVVMSAACPSPGRIEVGGALFMTGDSSQRMFVSAVRGDRTLSGVVSAGAWWQEPNSVPLLESFVRFVGEGVWHVLIGYDHVAFVLLLLLPSVLRSVNGRWSGDTRLADITRDIVMVVTAFTVAHSTTLALAATKTVTLPTQPIEIAIAASIAVAAAINLLPRLSRARLGLAFGFGLVHGFGFANVLAEVDTQGASIVPLLAGFNVGVELAQLGIVALVLPVIYAMRTRRWYASGVMPLGSCALGAAGVVWLLQRL
jgi:hypothetical protein